MIDKLKTKDPEKIANLIQCVMGENKFMSVTQLIPLIDLVKELVDNVAKEKDAEKIGIDIEKLKKELQAMLDKKDFIKETILGMRDLSPAYRTKWNLLHMNNNSFKDPMFFMNLSAITDVGNFVHPRGYNARGSDASVTPIAPMFKEKDGKLNIDWKNFSIDSVFLYLSSLGGFNAAPAGLFDAQVELAHTKSFLLDGRPLSASLTKNELVEMWKDKEVQEFIKKVNPKINTLEKFSDLPRNSLIPKELSSNIDSIDLGEVGGNHWDVPMKQAFTPPSALAKDGSFIWDFPQMAYMRALMQTFAMYNLYNVSRKNQE
ncbi:MAG: hypothetical protein HQK51_02140 [Oligoflexia bacterium]|nr:hypothetical protein [Oligoflexia bacterium]